MVLPIILSFLGSSMAGAGALGAMSPLVAGALGSGVGSLAQGDDPKDAVLTGLTGLAGGALLGGVGSGVGTGAPTAAATGTPVSMATGVTPTPGMMTAPPMRPPNLGAAPTAPSGGGGLFGGKGILGNMPAGTAPVPRPMEWPSMTLPQKAMHGVSQGALSRGGLGAMAGASYAPMLGIGGGLGESKKRDPRGGRGEYDPQPADRSLRPVSPDYRPGISPEYSYFNNTNPVGRYFKDGGIVETMEPIRMSKGGLMDPAMAGMAGMAGMASPMEAGEDTQKADAIEQLNDKELITAATMAIKGLLPDKESALALGAFLRRNGQESLETLIDDIMSGKAEVFPGQERGKVSGPGDGQDDMVTAKLGNFQDAEGQDVLLSDGEYIVPSDAVSDLGNGSTDAGANTLDKMVTDVRNARRGKTNSPNQITPSDILPV